MSSLLLRASRFAARHVATQRLNLRKGRGVVSLSFDDVPASACQNGADILEDFEANATFFVCGGLTEQYEQDQLCHSLDDLLQLQEHGHEIGCHTYSHLNCAKTDAAALAQDWDKNAAFFENNQLLSRGFAFPFGAYDLPAKIAASKRFEYCRITGGGTQLNYADLFALKAQSLYQNQDNLDYLSGLIETTAEQGGWLILYSHEVCEQPGPWGCTPDLLRQVLEMTTHHGSQILSIKRAINYFKAA